MNSGRQALRIITVAGARPNFIKIAPIVKELKKYKFVENIIIHTGQHYDFNMSDIFFKDLDIPEPDIYLGVGSGSHAMQTAKIMIEFEKVIESLDKQPDVVIVVGDVNSTLACSLVCSKIGIPIAHVESGLRSFDMRMPEEINRKLTDAISSYLFVTEPSGIRNLISEGVSPDKIHYVGNVMIDSLIQNLPKVENSKIVESLNLDSDKYVLLTLHRPSNVDVKDNLEKVLRILELISEFAKIVFPIHPRTKIRIHQFCFTERFSKINNLLVIEPVGYIDFLKLMLNSKVVLTDSGGVQEETTFLGIPCITLRENTERPITVEIGTNEVAGLDVEKVVNLTHNAVNGNWKKGRCPDLWDGKTSKRIVNVLLKTNL